MENTSKSSAFGHVVRLDGHLDEEELFAPGWGMEIVPVSAMQDKAQFIKLPQPDELVQLLEMAKRNLGNLYPGNPDDTVFDKRYPILLIDNVPTGRAVRLASPDYLDPIFESGVRTDWSFLATNDASFVTICFYVADRSEPFPEHRKRYEEFAAKVIGETFRQSTTFVGLTDYIERKATGKESLDPQIAIAAWLSQFKLENKALFYTSVVERVRETLTFQQIHRVAQFELGEKENGYVSQECVDYLGYKKAAEVFGKVRFKELKEAWDWFESTFDVVGYLSELEKARECRKAEKRISDADRPGKALARLKKVKKVFVKAPTKKPENNNDSKNKKKPKK